MRVGLFLFIMHKSLEGITMRLPYKAISLNKCRIIDGMAIVGNYAYLVVKALPNQRVLVEELPMHVGNQYD